MALLVSMDFIMSAMQRQSVVGKDVSFERIRRITGYLVGTIVEERHVPERDVAHGHVVVTGIFGFDALESLYPHPFFGVQVLQDQPRGGVFLEAGAPVSYTHLGKTRRYME